MRRGSERDRRARLRAGEGEAWQPPSRVAGPPPPNAPPHPLVEAWPLAQRSAPPLLPTGPPPPPHRKSRNSSFPLELPPWRAVAQRHPPKSPRPTPPSGARRPGTGGRAAAQARPQPPPPPASDRPTRTIQERPPYIEFGAAGAPLRRNRRRRASGAACDFPSGPSHPRPAVEAGRRAPLTGFIFGGELWAASVVC